MKRKLLVLIFVFLAISGCKGTLDSINSSPTNVTKPEPSMALTNTIVPSPTTISTLTLEATQTAQPMDKDEAMAFTSNLLQNPGKCMYPCFWDIVPGVSNWVDVNLFLMPFASSIKDKGFNKSISLEEYLVVAPIDQDISPSGKYSVVFFAEKSGDNPIVEQILIPHSIPDSLSNVINSYGEPEDIYFWSSGFTIGDPANQLVLVYHDFGALFIYEFESIVYAIPGSEAYIEVCLSDIQGDRPITHLWDTKLSNTDPTIFETIIRFYSDYGIKMIHELGSVTNSTNSNFFQAVINESNEDYCFQSSIEQWEN